MFASSGTLLMFQVRRLNLGDDASSSAAAGAFGPCRGNMEPKAAAKQ